jgi:two-component sensor histidine kinase
MSSAHELLASRPNEPIDLAELLGGLTPDDAGRHIDVAGPTCLVHPSRVRAIAMVFAELFTNARRHGALTRDDARIRIEWSREDEPDRWLLRWSEVGCDISDDSPIEGTGRKLVNGFARSELEGEADWRFEPDGLRFTLHLRTDARPTAPVPDYTSDRRPTSRFRAPEV